MTTSMAVTIIKTCLVSICRAEDHGGLPPGPGSGGRRLTVASSLSPRPPAPRSCRLPRPPAAGQAEPTDRPADDPSGSSTLWRRINVLFKSLKLLLFPGTRRVRPWPSVAEPVGAGTYWSEPEPVQRSGSGSTVPYIKQTKFSMIFSSLVPTSHINKRLFKKKKKL